MAPVGKAARPDRKPGETTSPAVDARDRDMGSALRSVYEKTVNEQVPDDLLDLLGKLT